MPPHKRRTAPAKCPSSLIAATLTQSLQKICNAKKVHFTEKYTPVKNIELCRVFSITHFLCFCNLFYANKLYPQSPIIRQKV